MSLAAAAVEASACTTTLTTDWVVDLRDLPEEFDLSKTLDCVSRYSWNTHTVPSEMQLLWILLPTEPIQFRPCPGIRLQCRTRTWQVKINDGLVIVGFAETFELLLYMPSLTAAQISLCLQRAIAVGRLSVGLTGECPSVCLFLSR